MDQLRGEEAPVHGDKACITRRLNFKQLNLPTSDPKSVPIRCMLFKKPAGGELAK